MTRSLVVVAVCIIIPFFSFAQDPLTAPLPEKFQGMKPELMVKQLPEKIYATTDESIPDYKYFWKHGTSILSPQYDVKIIEGGAYLFYNQQWNLRVSYKAKEFAKLFNCPDVHMTAAKTYTFEKNWRTGNECFGGWAMWYLIAEKPNGERIYGVGRIETVGAMAGEESFYELDKANSVLQWQGSAVAGNYSPQGTLELNKGELVLKGEEVIMTSIVVDMESLKANNPDLGTHLKAKDFFRVDKFPQATFELSTPFPLTEGVSEVTGTLTIRKTAKEMSFPVTISRKENRLHITGTWTIDRTEFGIIYNSPSYFDKLKDQAIADEFTITFDWVFEKKVD